MSSRRNFLDADDRIMERNLRFVKNDLEENFNQYFGGSGSRGNNSANVSVPPRDYKVIQPTPGGSHVQERSSGMEIRRRFLLHLGLTRHEAYELAKNKNFDVNHLEQKYNDYIARGHRQSVIKDRILSEIHNQNNVSENIRHQEVDISRKTPPAPIISKFYEEQEDFNFDRHDGRDRGNLYRSGSRPEAPSRSNQRDEPYQSAGPLPIDVKSREYFLRQANTRGNMPREMFRERSHSPIRYSPILSDHRVGNVHRSSRSRSRNRELHLMQERRDERYFLHDNFGDEVERNTMGRRSRSYSPSRTNRRVNYNRSSRSRSPNRRINETNFDRYMHDANMEDIRRDVARKQSPPRLYSPPRSVQREGRFHLSRSRSPQRDLNLMYDPRREGNFLQREQHEDFKQTIYEPPHSRAYSPQINDRRKEIDHLRSRSPDRFKGRNEYFSSLNVHFENDLNRGTDINNISRTMPTSNTMGFEPFGKTKQFTRDVFSNEEQSFEAHSNNRNIPSLLSLKIFPDQGDHFQQPSTSKKSNFHYQELNKKRELNINPTKFVSKERPPHLKEKPVERKEKPVLKKNRALIPIIKSGLRKPLPGHLKANPQDYWSQWWHHYKYIEYSLPKINPNDYEVKSCISFMVKPNSYEYLKQSYLLLNRAVKAIMKTVDINETNYYVRDIFKLFQYKNQLEDPNFQNALNPEQLNCIAPALRQFKIKPTMALLHQALIVRWHISLDILKKVQAGEPILSNYARMLLNHKGFHYLVMESIQELKKMCQQDWPLFNDFYRQIKAKKVDIYSLGVGLDLSFSANTH